MKANHFLVLVNLVCIMVLAVALMVNHQSVAAQPASTFTVESSSDDSQSGDSWPGDGDCLDFFQRCTLRAAIEEANAWPGPDTIVFTSTMTILIDPNEGNLPIITDQLTIDASSVWDSTNNKPGVSLNGGGAAIVTDGLQLQADNCQIYGLYISGFNSSGIVVQSASNTIGGTNLGQRNVISGNGVNGLILTGTGAQSNLVQNNYIGTTPSGSVANPNLTGIFIEGGAANNTIGGSTTAVGNVISGNTHDGVHISGSGSDGNTLGGNVIGVALDGNTALSNGQNGVAVTYGASYAYIGGGSALADNIISHNGNAGIYLGGAIATSVERNMIGFNDYGIYLRDGATNSYIAGNTITSNLKEGILVDGNTTLLNWFSENSIYSNGLKGIELKNGGNTELAAPTITSATAGGATGTSCAGCVVEIFSDAGDEGKIYHGTVDATAGGAWSYTGALTGPNITATATQPGSSIYTSEFSAPFALGGSSVSMFYLPLVAK